MHLHPVLWGCRSTCNDGLDHRAESWHHQAADSLELLAATLAATLRGHSERRQGSSRSPLDFALYYCPLCLLVYSCCTECCCDKEGGISEFRECHARLLSGQARADSQSLGRGLFALGLPYRCHHVVSPQNSARLGFVVSNHA